MQRRHIKKNYLPSSLASGLPFLPFKVSNPKCSYLLQINENTQDNKQTYYGLVTLLGEDLTGLNSGVYVPSFKKSRNLVTLRKYR